LARPNEKPCVIDGAEYIRIEDGAGHFLDLPSLTTTQRDALTPNDGMMIYNSTTNQIEGYQNSAWGPVGSSTSGALLLDQTTPQTVINGVPLMEGTPTGAADIKSLVNKEYIDLAVTSLGASYYMYDEDDATGYKTCYLDPSSDSETYLEKTSLSDGDYIGGWISADGIAPSKLLKGVYNWYVELEKTSGTKSLRVYWELIERKSGGSETVIATSSNSNEISSKESYLVPLQLNSDYIPDSGSRIVGKLYAAISGGGNAPTVRVYYQDGTSSRWEIPASSEIFKDIFVPYSGATQNIDLNGHAIDNVLSLATSEIKARDADGLKLTDDAGNGIFVEDGGDVGIGTASPTISDGAGLHLAGKILRIGTAKTPSSAGDTGNAGEICWDSDYVYVCVATNTWKRAALSSW